MMDPGAASSSAQCAVIWSSGRHVYTIYTCTKPRNVHKIALGVHSKPVRRQDGRRAGLAHSNSSIAHKLRTVPNSCLPSFIIPSKTADAALREPSWQGCCLATVHSGTPKRLLAVQELVAC
jgi:hypothetical protein